MQVIRNYVHKRFGKIGHVTLDAPKGEWKLDGNVLPESSVEHLVTFALQTLQDSYAGSDNTEEAVEAFTTKRQRLLDGTLGVRLGGGGVDPILVETRRLALKAWIAKDSDKRSAIVKEMEKSDRDAHADKILAAVPDDVRAKLTEMGESEHKRKLAEKEAKRKAANKVSDAIGDIEL